MRDTRRPRPLRQIVMLLTAGLLVPALAAAAAAPGPSQRADLRWRFEPGAVFVYRTSMVSETELPQGMGMSTTEMETTQSWHVIEVNDVGDATVRITNDHVRMNMVSPMGTMSVDSADETSSTGTPLDAVTAMAGVGYTVVLDPHGQMKDVRGLEEMHAALRDSLGAGAGAMIDQMINAESIRGQWAQGGFALPSESVGAGSTWDRAFTFPMPNVGAMTVSTAYEVASIDGGVVTITSTGTMSMAEGGAAQSPIPMDIGEAYMTATTLFDTNRGVVTVTDTTIDMQMSMSMGGQTMDLDSLMTMRLELVGGGS